MYSKDIKIGQFIFAKAHLSFNYDTSSHMEHYFIN